MFDFIGGHPVLDFNNTAAWPRGRPSHNRLAHPASFIRWASEAKVFSTSEETKLRRLLRTKYDRTRGELTEAHRFRGMLHEMLIAAAHNCPPAGHVLVEFDLHLRKAGKSMKREWHEGHLQWMPPAATNLTSIIDRIAWRAGELFASKDIDRLRCCANPECGWFFIDRSSNKTRRWCNMRECGDRAKSRRYYEKKSKKRNET